MSIARVPRIRTACIFNWAGVGLRNGRARGRGADRYTFPIRKVSASEYNSPIVRRVLHAASRRGAKIFLGIDSRKFPIVTPRVSLSDGSAHVLLIFSLFIYSPAHEHPRPFASYRSRNFGQYFAKVVFAMKSRCYSSPVCVLVVSLHGAFTLIFFYRLFTLSLHHYAIFERGFLARFWIGDSLHWDNLFFPVGTPSYSKYKCCPL